MSRHNYFLPFLGLRKKKYQQKGKQAYYFGNAVLFFSYFFPRCSAINAYK